MNEPKHVCIVQYQWNPPESELKDVCKKAYIKELSNNNNLDQESNWIASQLPTKDWALYSLYQKLKSKFSLVSPPIPSFYEQCKRKNKVKQKINNISLTELRSQILPNCKWTPWWNDNKYKQGSLTIEEQQQQQAKANNKQKDNKKDVPSKSPSSLHCLCLCCPSLRTLQQLSNHCLYQHLQLSIIHPSHHLHLW